MVREDIPGAREGRAEELRETLINKKWSEAGGSRLGLAFLCRAGEISACRKQRGGPSTARWARAAPVELLEGLDCCHPAQPLRP